MLTACCPSKSSAAETPAPLIKCLVWDLDNTLWQGTLLEGETVVVSEAVRSTIVGLDARGILQSVASRNDHEHAFARLEELGLAEYLILPQIGWGAKSRSILTLVEELGFAEQAIGFIDDQAAEREEVKRAAPGVRCYDAAQAAMLLELPEFTPAVVTSTAIGRRAMYAARSRRERARTEFEGADEDFLRSLELVLRIKHAREPDIARLEELTLRTSQMNATGVHYSAEALRALLADEDHRVLVASMNDRFGEHGAIGVMLVALRAQVWHLKLLATSCRVVAFGTGGNMLQWLVNEAASAAVHLVADFRPTTRNRVMEIAYRFAGFSRVECARCHGSVAQDSSVQRLHLLPVRKALASTMHFELPNLEVRDDRRSAVAHEV